MILVLLIANKAHHKKQSAKAEPYPRFQAQTKAAHLQSLSQ
ncbi:hypothetical protein VS84_02247 [Vibrio cholerae]|nr:hypothetical protein VS84_02247 [Vibrio cholerae]KKP19851.1 hypothetical protein VS86_02303 [Vibrio cholerae]